MNRTLLVAALVAPAFSQETAEDFGYCSAVLLLNAKNAEKTGDTERLASFKKRIRFVVNARDAANVSEDEAAKYGVDLLRQMREAKGDDAKLEALIDKSLNSCVKIGAVDNSEL